MASGAVIVKVREMILSGALPAGARVTEAGLAQTLGISRTPIRNALPALAREGLLEPVGRRGYAVKAFSVADSVEAIDLRSMIEGFAARAVAERGASPQLREILAQCLADGDALLAKRRVEPEDEDRYGAMNACFHQSIVSEGGSGMIRDIYARVITVPFAAPTTIAFDKYGLERAYEHLFYAHRQHHAITTAILAGEGDRAERLFREHAHNQRSSLWSGEGD